MQKAGKPGYNRASNEKNAAHHIWDSADHDGCMGATACVGVRACWDAHQQPGDWQFLTRWIDHNLLLSDVMGGEHQLARTPAAAGGKLCGA